VGNQKGTSSTPGRRERVVSVPPFQRVNTPRSRGDKQYRKGGGHPEFNNLKGGGFGKEKLHQTHVTQKEKMSRVFVFKLRIEGETGQIGKKERRENPRGKELRCRFHALLCHSQGYFDQWVSRDGVHRPQHRGKGGKGEQKRVSREKDLWVWSRPGRGKPTLALCFSNERTAERGRGEGGGTMGKKRRGRVTTEKFLFFRGWGGERKEVFTHFPGDRGRRLQG